MTNDDTPGPRRKGIWRSLTDRLTKSSDELEDADLMADSERLGGTPICDLPDRERATVCGSVRSVTLRPKVDVPALVVELYDGSMPLHLVWLGRRQIVGIEPGVFLQASGRVSYSRGTPTIFNPSYEIVPQRG